MSKFANQMKTVLLLGALSSILIGIGAFMGGRGIYLMTGIAVLMNFGSYFFSHKIVLAMHRAKPVTEAEDPRLFQMVRELAGRARMPMPKIYTIDDPQPNAFATGRNPENGVVAVTTGIRRLLPDRELRGVIAHELAHIRNRDILVATIAAMIASVVSMVAHMIQWGAIFGMGRRDDDEDRGGGMIGMIVLALVAPIAATVIQLAISRSREYLADETGGEISGEPDALADALQRIERGIATIPTRLEARPATASLFIASPLRGGGVMSLFSTHPAMAERARRLREQARRQGVGVGAGARSR